MNVLRHFGTLAQFLRRAPRRARSQPQPRRPHLELLEDRTVPTVVFGNPSNPAGIQTVYGNGPVISNPNVILVFWGAGWNDPANAGLMQATQNAASAITSSAYLNGLNQYSGAGAPEA